MNMNMTYKSDTTSQNFKNMKGKNKFGLMKTVLELYKKLYKGKAREKLIRTYLLLKLNVF